MEFYDLYTNLVSPGRTVAASVGKPAMFEYLPWFLITSGGCEWVKTDYDKFRDTNFRQYYNTIALTDQAIRLSFCNPEDSSSKSTA